MRRVWLASYPSGVAPDINLNECASLNDMLGRSCRKFRHAPAFRNMGATISFEELDQLTRDFAAWLQSRSELRKGSRVAIMMPNLLQYPVAMFGILRAGMIVVNVNPLYTGRELEHQLSDAGVDAIVILENFAAVLEKVLPRTSMKLVVVTAVSDLLPLIHRPVVNFVVRHVKKLVPNWCIPGAVSFNEVLNRGRRAVLREATPQHQDVALLQYTGGTTGTAKGAVLTHGNLVANLLQARAWSRGTLEEGCETIITALPLYHIFSFTTNCLLSVELGALNVLITNPRDVPGFVKELSKSRFTVLTGVNTLFNVLLNAPGIERVDFSRLKISLGGGAAIHHSVAQRWQALTNRPLIEGYGLTEAAPLVACNLLERTRLGSIGLPLPSNRYLDPRRGRSRTAHRSRGRDLCPRSADHAGLLEPAGRDGKGN